MKNQNDLIFSIVGFVVLLIVVGVCIGTRPEVPVPTPPEKVNTAAPAYPQGVTPVMANALPNASGSSGSGGPGIGGPGGGGPGGRGSAPVGPTISTASGGPSAAAGR